MKIEEIIKKFSLEIVEKDGQEMLKTCKKPTERQVAEIKAKKSEIIAELKRQKEENAIRIAKEVEQRKIQYEKNKEEYIRKTDLRRCIVSYSDEWLNTKWYIETLCFVDDGEYMRAYQADFGLSNHIGLKYTTEKLEAYYDKKGTMYGFGGTAWEITPEEEAELIADQIPAEKEAIRIEVEKEAEKAARQAEKEAERQAKFDRARETGEPVELYKYTDECNNPREECNLDIIYGYAMPDGTVKEKRIHTY